MTDKNDILRQIEAGLGSEGSTQLALAMLDELKANGGIQFWADSGYQFTDEDEFTSTENTYFQRALQVVLEDQ